MLFADIDVPEDLLRALDADQLVIFAGAGVSKGPPSCLPLFDELAEEIGQRELSAEEKGHLDSYLGELKDGGVEVHVQAAQILGRPTSQPNDLHRDLLRIFRHHDRVRLVTTNFDRHFEHAASELWPDTELEVWRAPGLPVGDDFGGLVCLHGSLAGPSDRLVLTDEDFGRAYLTQGWARRFLLRLFPKYTVLFVGYSHGDTVLQYLARGLPAGTAGKRFALTDETDLNRWKYLGIEAFQYNSGDDHGPLNDAVAEWADFVGQSALEHERYAQERLSGRPGNPQDEGRLLWYLDHPNYWRYFVEHAASEHWFTWLEQKGKLKPLLKEAEGEATEAHRGLLVWIAECSAAADSFSARALRWFGLSREPIAQSTWGELAGRFELLWHASNTATRERLRPWLATLLDRRPEGTNPRLFNFIAEDLDPSEDSALALLFFEHLTDVHLVGDEYAAQDSLQLRTNVRIEVAGDAVALMTAWQRWKDNVDLLAEGILVIGERHLRKARWLLSASGVTGDLSSLLRTAIADDDADRAGRRHRGINTLIDAVRDALEWVIEKRTQEGVLLARRWVDSSVPLLRRLGIHGLTLSTALTGSEKLLLVLDHSLLVDPYAHREVRRLLKSAYSDADPEVRTSLLRRARRVVLVDVIEQRSPDKALRRARSLRALLSDLREADPDCEIVSREIDRLEQEFPEIQPEQEPTPVEVPSSEELIRNDPRSVVQLLASLHDHLRAGGPVTLLESDLTADFLATSTRAAKDDFDWSLRLAAHLRSNEDEESSLWRSLIRGWDDSVLPRDQWRNLMEFLERGLPPSRFDATIADLLEHRVKELGDDEEEPGDFVGPAIAVARSILARRTRDDDDLTSGNQGWLGLAINRPAGKIALFVVVSISVLKRTDSELPRKESSDLFSLLEQLVDAPGNQSRLGRPVLCSQIRFFYAHYQEWAREKLLPPFSWKKDAESAAQAWDGFIVWGGFSPRVWADLRPSLEQTFDHLGELDRHERMSNQLARDLAGPAFFLSDDPMTEGWLRRFLEKADQEQRRAWAAGVLEVLKGLDGDEKRASWERWLRDFFRERLAGRPPLKEQEWTLMHEWALYLERDFPELVGLVAQRAVHPRSLDFLTYLCGQVDGRGSFDRDALFEFPNDVARFLIHVLENPPQNVWFLSALGGCLVRLVESGVERTLLEELSNRVRELGGQVPTVVRDSLADDEEE